ncbi:hypothetical protein, partial [Candidatus Bandiella numerosa]|uniref:hypothetical protein n=1 Tax=Candidatus Bandiella numerosa TaxID=2570586 RepID=UPI001F330282
ICNNYFLCICNILFLTYTNLICVIVHIISAFSIVCYICLAMPVYEYERGAMKQILAADSGF